MYPRVTCMHIPPIVIVNHVSQQQQIDSHRSLRDNALLCSNLASLLAVSWEQDSRKQVCVTSENKRLYKKVVSGEPNYIPTSSEPARFLRDFFVWHDGGDDSASDTDQKYAFLHETRKTCRTA